MSEWASVMYRVEVTARPGVQLEATAAIEQAIAELGVDDITEVEVERIFYLDGPLTDAERAALTEAMGDPAIEEATWLPADTPRPAPIGTRVVEVTPRPGVTDRAATALSRRARALGITSLDRVATATRYVLHGRLDDDLVARIAASVLARPLVHRYVIGAAVPPSGVLDEGMNDGIDDGIGDGMAENMSGSVSVMALHDDIDLVLAVATSTHLAAREPFGAAHAAIGHADRALLAASARPIAGVTALCVGPDAIDAMTLPLGVRHPRRVAAEATQGIEDYIEVMAMPIIAGATCHDPAFVHHPLIFVGAIGIRPSAGHHASHRDRPEPAGDATARVMHAERQPPKPSREDITLPHLGLALLTLLARPEIQRKTLPRAVILPIEANATNPSRRAVAVAMAISRAPHFDRLDRESKADGMTGSMTDGLTGSMTGRRTGAAVDEAIGAAVALGGDPDQLTCNAMAAGGTVLITTLAIVPDRERTPSRGLQRAGSHLILVGDTRAEWHATALARLLGVTGGDVAAPVSDALPRARAVHHAITAGHALACHALGPGGLAVALADMCLGGSLGATVDLARMPCAGINRTARAFAESPSRWLLEVTPEAIEAITTGLNGMPWAAIGTTGGDHLRLLDGPHPVVELPIAALATAALPMAALTAAATRKDHG